MSVACTSCGHPIPAGQFRCGKCGAVQSGELEDPGEIAASAAASVRPSPPRAAETAAPLPEHVQSQGEDEAQKEFVVPRGTFASETPPSRDGDPSEPVPHAQATSDERANASRAESKLDATRITPDKGHASSQRMRVARSPERPPFLASEILREDIAPKEPGRTTLAVVLALAPTLGLASLLIAGFQSMTAIALAVLYVVLACLGRVQFPYAQRATWLAMLSGLPLAGAMWWRYASGAGLPDLLLAAGVPALSCSLYLRSWYRNSMIARALVAVSLVPSCIWAFSMSHRGLLSLEFMWQSWLPAVTWYVLVILCLLSLLAFMGDETTGGCTAWAVGLSGWYGAYASLRFALDADVVEVSPRTLGLAEPVLAAVLGIALAQLLARLLARKPNRIEPALATPT